jgi:hypothetical protein
MEPTISFSANEEVEPMPVTARNWLRFPVVSAGAEHLVMGYLMRRNILAYKAPPNNQGYDLICIHPDPRHRPVRRQWHRVLVQVKSRYATDCDRGFPVRADTLNAFDFLIVAFLNIGRFAGRNNGSTGQAESEFYTLPRDFVRAHHVADPTWQKVRLTGLEDEIEPYRNQAGFEQIAKLLGIRRPVKTVEMELVGAK